MFVSFWGIRKCHHINTDWLMHPNRFEHTSIWYVHLTFSRALLKIWDQTWFMSGLTAKDLDLMLSCKKAVLTCVCWGGLEYLIGRQQTLFWHYVNWQTKTAGNKHIQKKLLLTKSAFDKWQISLLRDVLRPLRRFAHPEGPLWRLPHARLCAKSH